MKALGGIVVAVLLASPVEQASSCDFPPRELLQAPRSEYRGRYVNEAYHYSVRIPDKLVGYDQPTPPHHGFGIAVGASPQSYIVVYGESNSLEFNTASAAARQLVEYLREDGRKIAAQSTDRAKLGSLDAALLVVRYSCPGSEDRYVQASMVALSVDKAALYEVSLHAVANRFDHDRALFERLLRSWKYTGPSK